MASAGRLCSVRVASATDFRAQVGDSNPFELIHDFQAVELVLSLPETARLLDVRRLAAERLGAPPQGLRFWRWAQRRNGTYRPHAPVEDGSALSALARRGHQPPAVHLFLERAAPGSALPPYNPSTNLMVFVKAFRGTLVPEPVKYMGHAVLQSTLPLRAQLPELRRVAGMAGRGEVDIVEEVQHSPPRVDPVDLSHTPREAELESGDILVLAHGAEGQDARSWLLRTDRQGRAGTTAPRPPPSPQQQPPPQQQLTQQIVQPAAQRQGSRTVPPADPQPGPPRAQQPDQPALLPPLQQQVSPADQPPATPSAAERAVQLLQQAAQEAGQAALEQAQLRRQVEQATAQAEQAVQQVARLQEQLAAKEAQLLQLSSQQPRQTAFDQVSSSSRAEQATPQQRQQLLALEGDEAACRALSVAELQALHDQLEGSTARLRRLLVDRRVEEAQAEAQARATECSVCISAAKDTRLSPCGHLLCRQCSLRVAHCPVCRQAVVGRERAFL
ncbi:hypothetical protein ABPG75_002090 [Micractinium tetrahymenae]